MKPIKTTLCGLLLSGVTALAGTFTADFATPDTSQFTLTGTGTLTDGSAWAPVIATNRCILTVNQNNLNGAFAPYDFDGGAVIDSFTASFKLQFGPGTGNAADGAAFSFGPGVSQAVAYSEQGAGSGAFAVSFHTYTSNGGPAVDVYLNGTRIATAPMAKADMVNSTLQDVVIQLNPNSTLNISYRGVPVITNLYLPDWGPTAGFYNISGRTGGENEETDIAAVSINTTLHTTDVIPSFSANPTNYTVAEGGAATFSASFDGTGPFSIQWLQNGNAIPGANSQVLTLSPVYYADNNSQIAVQVTGPGGTATSSAATLTVIRDVTAPTVLSATADTSFTTVLVKYSEPVSDTALDPSHYNIDQGVTIYGLSRQTASSVQLTTSQLGQGVGYNLTINGVQDMATTPNTIAPNTTVRFQTSQLMVGTVIRKKYTGFNDTQGSDPNNLFGDPRFPNQPDHQDLLTAFEYPANGGTFNASIDSDKLFFDTIDGYFIPPVSGNYVFFVTRADRAWLFLSPDDNPANRVMIAGGVGGWSDPRAWLTANQFDVTQSRSDQSPNNQWPGGPTITLQAGQRYYIMLVHHMPDWAGGSWMDATYKLDTDPDPANGTASTLTGNVIAAYLDPTGTTVSFAQEPKSAAVLQGQSAAFTADASGTSPYGAGMSYQWQTAPAGSSTFTNIPGATSATLQTAGLSLADNGRQYRCVATVPPVSQISSVVTVSVSADTTPPTVSAGAMAGANGTIYVGVGFDEPVDDATGSAQANYTVSSGTITSINWYSNRFTADSQNPLVMFRKQNALLTVTGFTGTSGTLTVRNVKDLYNNAIGSVVVPFTVNAQMQWGVVGANEFGGWNAVVPVAGNGWDVYSDGMTEWANYDETTFVYEQVTGDFDKKVRVQYQDGSSTWARAGLIVRDVLNFGVDRTTQATTAGRYQKCHVNPVGPVLSGPGNQGNAIWEGNRRLDTGGQCTSAITNVNSTPLYPSAWCRIKRVGQTFTIFRSDDGTNWVTLGTTTWGVDDSSKTPMPDTVYVGPEYSPENGNISLAADQGTFLAQFRDYGNVAPVIFDPGLKIGRDSTTGQLTITWTTGTLVSSPTPGGTYTAVSGAQSPLVFTPGPGAVFFRVQQ